MRSITSLLCQQKHHKQKKRERLGYKPICSLFLFVSPLSFFESKQLPLSELGVG